MTCTGIVIGAAGSGTRLGRNMPKAFVPVAGETMLARSLRGLSDLPGATAVVVAVPPGDEHANRQAEEALASLSDLLGERLVHATTIAGGQTRFDSVRAALQALPEACDAVLVHDAARALTPPELFVRVAQAVREYDCGVVPVLPVVDTVKTVDDTGTVVATPDRATLRAAQTPQGFPAASLRAAYEAGQSTATDDAATYAANGGNVRTVTGDPLAFKITTPQDLERAECLMNDTPAASALPEIRVGIGTDIHAFDAAAPCWLAGIHFPHEPGLSGHSDGDAAAHALVDALLSAAGLGDIGTLFGTDDPQFAGARGSVFLTVTRERLAQAGWQIQNAAVQVVCRRPRFGARAAEASSVLSQLLGAPVSVSATTSDGLGFMADTTDGGVFAFATACLRRG